MSPKKRTESTTNSKIKDEGGARAKPMICLSLQEIERPIVDWVAKSGRGQLEVENLVAEHLRRMPLEIEANNSVGQLTVLSYVVTAVSTSIIGNSETHITSIKSLESGITRATLMLPLSFNYVVSADFAFSVKNSLENKTVEMGSRTAQSYIEADVLSKIIVDIPASISSPDEVELVGVELPFDALTAHFGEISIYDPEEDDF